MPEPAIRKETGEAILKAVSDAAESAVGDMRDAVEEAVADALEIVEPHLAAAVLRGAAERLEDVDDPEACVTYLRGWANEVDPLTAVEGSQ